VQRGWRRHRAKGGVFAFAPTFALRGTSSTKSSGAEGVARWWRIHSRKSHSGSNHAFMYENETSSSRHSTHVKMPKKKSPIASNEPNVSFKTFDASYVLTNKSGKVAAKYVGGKHKGSKTCVWVPKVLVSNAKGPKTVWVPKNKA
jgi:3D (Asp-Asp-Asp) domain-containing protein